MGHGVEGELGVGRSSQCLNQTSPSWGLRTEREHLREGDWTTGTLGIPFGGSWDPDGLRGSDLKGIPEYGVPYICTVEFQALSRQASEEEGSPCLRGKAAQC